MSETAASTVPATLPWTDRGADDAKPAGKAGQPRSQRDVEILRGLARRINPYDAGAHNNLGVVYYNKGMYAEAVDHFERAIEIDPDMQVAERNLHIAYFGTGYFDELIEELKARLEANENDVAARDRLARALLYTGDPDGALAEWGDVLRRTPDDPHIHEQIARAHLRRDEQDAALAALRRAAALDPDNARLHFQIGSVLYRRGAPDEARDALERAVSLDATLADAFHLLSFVYGELGLEERAAVAAKRASELNPGYTHAEANLSIDSHSKARYEELIGEHTQQKPSVAEGGALAHYNLGLAFRQKALYDEALREFRLAAERGEDRFLVQQAQAEMLLLRGAGDEATQVYRSLIDLEAGSPKLWNELGVAHHQSGQLEEAERAYQRALDLDPLYALACSNFAVVQLHRGSVEEAERYFRRAIEQRPVPDVLRNLGLMLARTGRPAEAMDAYRQALELDPLLVSAWLGLGEILLEQQQPAEAKSALLRAVELDPQNAEGRYRLAFALSALGDYQGALRETRHALELNPYIPTPRFRLLIDLQFEEASVPAPELDIAQQVEKDSGVTSFEFAAGALDDLFERADPLAHAIASAPAPALPVEEIESELSQARRALASGLLENAQAHAQQAQRLGADTASVQLMLGNIFLQRGLAGEAVERFRGVIEARREAPDSPELLAALQGAARALLVLKRGGEALAVAEELERIAPEHPLSARLVGEAALMAGDAARARRSLDRALAASPDDVPLLVLTGTAHARSGEMAEAERVLRRALEIDDFAVAARVALGRSYALGGDEDAAAREFRAALDVLPSYGEAAFALADLETKRGHLRDAVHVLVDLLTVDPYHLDGLVRLGTLLTRLGRVTEAGVAFRRVLHFDPGHQQALAGLEALMPTHPDAPAEPTPDWSH